MSELIEQLALLPCPFCGTPAKEVMLGREDYIECDNAACGNYGNSVATSDAWNTRYQAAAPIDNVAEALEQAAKIAEQMPLNSNDDAHQYRFSDDCKAISWDIAVAIRKLIPTQANRTEGK